MRRLLKSLFPLLCIWGIVTAGVPTTDGVFPCGGKAGTTVKASLSGKADPWPPRFWCSNPKVTVTAGEKSPAVVLKIGPDATPGSCLIRAWNKEGASEPFFFIVGDTNETEYVEIEKEDNGSPGKAMVLDKTLPAVVYGRLGKSGDIDCYQIALQKGDQLHAFLECYALRTGADSLLHLYNEQGERIEMAHDNAVNLDPELIYPIEKDANYTLAVMAIATPPNANVSFHGGSKCVYRLNLGVNKSQLPGRLIPTPGKTDADLAKTQAVPIDLFGTLSKKREVDVIRFSARAKERLLIEVNAFSHRFPTDPVFVLRSADGSLIKEIDDVKPSRDGSYLWTVRADGEYEVAVSDRFHKGGPEYRYQLKVRPEQPGFSASITAPKYEVKAGEELELKVNVSRFEGHVSALEVRINGLPEGLTCELVEAPAKSGEAKLKLKAAPGIAAHSIPFSIEVAEKGGKNRIKKAICSFQDKNARGPYLINETSELWLTVKGVE